jgi:transcriptional regulator with XRE-family HTH domain
MVDADRPASLADRLDLLFRTVHPSDRGPYSNKEVAAAIRERGGSISDVYIWQLRTGRRDNPTKDHLEWLAAFFDVDPAYFFDRREAEEIRRDLLAIEAMKNLKVRRVAARLGELADHNLDAVSEIIDRVVLALQAGNPTPVTGAETNQAD